MIKKICYQIVEITTDKILGWIETTTPQEAARIAFEEYGYGCRITNDKKKREFFPTGYGSW